MTPAPCIASSTPTAETVAVAAGIAHPIPVAHAGDVTTVPAPLPDSCSSLPTSSISHSVLMPIRNAVPSPYAPSVGTACSRSECLCLRYDRRERKKEKKRGTGPTGRLKQLFEQANDFPRSQQQKIPAVLEAFSSQNRQTAKQKV